jgi:outer membrane receptor for ferrienterochelin and colicin
MNLRHSFNLWATVLILLSQIGVAQASQPAISLSELLDLKITIASGEENELNQRESPGIITVLTRQEIDALGVTNLFEVLRYVAGYQFGVDESGLESFLVRGNYGGAGQLLIQYNGVPINEISFGSTVYAGHFSIDHIERIEIIRGPGSALYGGTAQLGVINVISKQYSNTVEATVATDMVSNDSGYATGSLGVGIGGEADDNFSLDFYAGYNKRDRTDSDYNAVDGTLIPDASEFFENENEFFQVKASAGGLNAKLLYSELTQNFVLRFRDRNTTINDAFLVDSDTPGTISYRSLITQVGYGQTILKNTTLNANIFYGSYDSGEILEDTVMQYPEWL